MKVTRLRTFIVISVIFHVVILSLLAAFFITRDMDKKPGHMQIPLGLISQDNGSTSGTNKTSNPLMGNPSKLKTLKSKKRSASEQSSVSKSLDSGELINKRLEIATLENNAVKNTVEKKEKKNEAFEKSVSDETNKNLNVKRSISTQNSQTEIHSTGGKFSNINDNSRSKLGSEIASSLSAEDLNVAYPDYKLNPKPGYPMIARRRGYEGSVLLRVWVLESGSVGKVELEKSSGYEILDESALKAVREWVFTPGKRNGESIPSWVTVPIRFQLNSG